MKRILSNEAPVLSLEELKVQGLTNEIERLKNALKVNRGISANHITPQLAQEGFLDVLFGKKKEEAAKEESEEDQIRALIESFKTKTFSDGSRSITGPVVVFGKSDKLIKALTDITKLLEFLPGHLASITDLYLKSCDIAEKLGHSKDVDDYCKRINELSKGNRPPSIPNWSSKLDKDNVYYHNQDQTLVIRTTYSQLQLKGYWNSFDYLMEIADLSDLFSLDYGVAGARKLTGAFEMVGKSGDVASACTAVLELLLKNIEAFESIYSKALEGSKKAYTAYETVDACEEEDFKVSDADEFIKDDLVGGVYGLAEAPYQNLYQFHYDVVFRVIDLMHHIHAL